MKVKMVIHHMPSGHIWVGDESDEVTEEDFELVKTALKEQIANLTFIELGETIIPGELIRQHCVITFQKS